MEDQNNSKMRDSFYSTVEEELLEQMNGYMATQLIYVMAELEIADLLKEGSKNSTSLAQELNIDLRKLRQVLRSLVYYGLLEQPKEDFYTLTPKGKYLCGGFPGSLKYRAKEIGKINYKVWANLKSGLETGNNIFEQTIGTSYFDYLNQDYITSIGFHNSMIRVAKETAPAIIDTYNFDSVGKIIDVGGGGGIFISEVLKRNPTAKGILYERDPSVIKRAEVYIEENGISSRCEIIQGDFFETVPAGGDIYILSWIIHDWDDQRSISILKNVQTAMRSQEDSKLLLIEQLVPDVVIQPAHYMKNDVARSNMAMLGLTDGCERTVAEYADLLKAAGLQINKVIPTNTFRSIIEATRTIA